jgi:hypothetical protein
MVAFQIPVVFVLLVTNDGFIFTGVIKMIQECLYIIRQDLADIKTGVLQCWRFIKTCEEVIGR